MVDYKKRLLPEPLRKIAGSTLDNTYKVIQTPITHESRMLVLINYTGVLVYISWDGVNDHLPLLPGATVVLDETSNAVSGAVLATAANTQFYAKAPGGLAGAENVFLSTFYAF